MRVLVFGATGMIGHGAVLECLDDPDISEVVTVGRRSIDVAHAKLTQIEHRDFTDFSSLRDQLSGFDACLWCLGVSSTGMSADDYRRITVDFTVAAAKVLAEVSPGLTFCFISGAGTDRGSRQMWARVKAEAEDKLTEFPFKAVYHFRPAMIIPKRGVRSTITSYRIMYAMFRPFYGVLKKFPKFVTNTQELGQAMIRAARSGYSVSVLENDDICKLGA